MAPFEASDVGLGDQRVLLDREQQREGDEAVALVVVDRPQHVGGIDDIGDRDALVERDRVESFTSQLVQRLVVVG